MAEAEASVALRLCGCTGGGLVHLRGRGDMADTAASVRYNDRGSGSPGDTCATVDAADGVGNAHAAAEVESSSLGVR